MLCCALLCFAVFCFGLFCLTLFCEISNCVFSFYFCEQVHRVPRRPVSTLKMHFVCTFVLLSSFAFNFAFVFAFFFCFLLLILLLLSSFVFVFAFFFCFCFFFYSCSCSCFCFFLFSFAFFFCFSFCFCSAFISTFALLLFVQRRSLEQACNMHRSTTCQHCMFCFPFAFTSFCFVLLCLFFFSLSCFSYFALPCFVLEGFFCFFQALTLALMFADRTVVSRAPRAYCDLLWFVAVTPVCLPACLPA